MDTVFNLPPDEIYYDREFGVIWSPDGLGADDRAGVFAIFKILQRGLRPTLIFTTDEEIGAVGAEELVKKYPLKPPTPIKYIIELDRRGVADCVFYSCANNDFIRYVENFGFIEDFGTFSDISVICPEWGIAGVNLSIGYKREHSYSETLHVEPLFATINKVCAMLKEKNIPTFEYIEASYNLVNKEPSEKCDGCHTLTYEYDLIPTLTDKKKKFKHYCIDCCSTKVKWCKKCGEAFESKTNSPLCINCRGGKLL